MDNIDKIYQFGMSLALLNQAGTAESSLLKPQAGSIEEIGNGVKTLYSQNLLPVKDRQGTSKFLQAINWGLSVQTPEAVGEYFSLSLLPPLPTHTLLFMAFVGLFSSTCRLIELELKI